MTSLGADHNAFTRNGVAISRQEDGVDYWQARISENAFIANGDGIYLPVRGPDASAHIARNIAVKNKLYGIYAPGATDGGGNRAVGNGRPCVGVACSRQ